jgi:hypothetical protein
MNFRHKSTKRRTEAGAAMLIAIFALLLISVIAIALIVSSGTETALAKNYRTSTSAYYAGLAGLEEGRGRLLWRNANYLNNTIPGFMPASGNPSMTLSQVLYIKNPAGAEVVDPTDLSGSNPYADNEYQQEFGIPVTSATVSFTNSVSGAGGVPGPQFKWVRISPATEKSLGVDVAGDGNTNDSTSPLFYDPAHVDRNGILRPGLVKGTAGPPPVPPTPTSIQVLQITALAVIPPNTQKLLQYVVLPVDLTISSALTLAGNNVTFAGSNSASFKVTGNDNLVARTCANPPVPPVLAIGYTNSADNSNANIVGGTSPGKYPGISPPVPPNPSVGWVTLTPSLQKPSSLDSLAQWITQNATVVLPGTSLPNNDMGSPASPVTVAVQGDLDMTAWHHTGYGLLLVTGKLTYDPVASWYGIVLVIGKGVVVGSNAGTGIIQGAMYVAQTRDPNTGSLLPDPTLGATSVTFDPAMGGLGIQYDSCWVGAAGLALQPITYQVLSFREIPLG